MKKILFYCDTVFGVGGVQRVLAEVAKRLSEEYEVTILTTDDILSNVLIGQRMKLGRPAGMITIGLLSGLCLSSMLRSVSGGVCDRSAVVLCVNIYFRRMNGLVLCMHGVSSYCLIRTN